VNAIDYLVGVGLCVAPVAELRGGLPYLLARGLAPAAAWLLAVGANLLIVPLVLVGLDGIERLLRRSKTAAKLLDAILARTRRKGRWIDRFGSLGLILLVAIPLPGTGAWTGSLAAVLMGVPRRKALLLVAVGVVVAGLLVLFASLGAFRLFGLG